MSLISFKINEYSLAIALLFLVTQIYECKYDKPITAILGKLHLFEGTITQRIIAWITLIAVTIAFALL